MVMVARSDIRQFVFEGSGIFAKEVVDGDTKKVRQLLEKHPEVMCNVYGGPSKIVFEEDDGSYTMKKSAHNIGAEVIFKYM